MVNLKPGQRLRQLIPTIRRVSLPGGLRLWITLASISFVAVALFSHAAQLRRLSLAGGGWWWLALGVGFSWGSLMVNALAWRVLMDWLGHRPDGVPLIPLYLRSNLLKYLPGGVWHFVDRIRALRPAIGSGPALAAVMLEPLLMAAAALLLVPLGGWQSGLALLCCLPAVLLIPRWREPLLRRLEKAKVKQLDRVDQALVGSLDPELLGSGREGYPWWPLGMEMAFLLCRFAGFWCCVTAFSLGPSLGWGEWVSGFALAWTIGLVVPAAPGGLGVFEAVLLLALGAEVSEGPLLAVALSYRVIVTLADGLAAAGVAGDRILLSRWGPPQSRSLP
ncbi:MAG: lysylphosphatidylglycerol synthase domain-containing protein [Prochlorococcus sp.]